MIGRKLALRDQAPVDLEAACIICNWAGTVLWPYFGLGALGAAAAGAAAASAFGGSGGFSGAGEDHAGADDSNPDLPPRSDPRDSVSYRARVHRFKDSSGNPYWPGISPIPGDGIVYPRDDRYMYEPLPVEPITGRPIWPPAPIEPTERQTSSGPAAARG